MTSWKAGWLVAVALGVFAPAVVACDGDDDDDFSRDTTSSSSGGGGSSSSGNGGGSSSSSGSVGDASTQLTAAEVMGVMATVNTGEITQGQLAQQRGASQAAKDFGADMVQMHTAAQTRQAALAQQLGLTVAPSAVSQQLEAKATTKTTELQTLEGAAFDRAYLEGQVVMHADVLVVIDDVLLPSAQDATLRQELQTSRGEVSMHLDHARMLVEGLGADGGTHDGGASDASIDGSP